MAYVLMRTVSDNNGKITLVPCEPALQLSIFSKPELKTNYYYLDEANNELYLLLNKGLYSIKDLTNGWKAVMATDYAFVIRYNYKLKTNKVFLIFLKKHYSNRSIVNLFFNILFLKQGLSKNARKRLIMLIMNRPEMHQHVYRLDKRAIYLNRDFHFELHAKHFLKTGVITTHDFFQYEESNY